MTDRSWLKAAIMGLYSDGYLDCWEVAVLFADFQLREGDFQTGKRKPGWRAGLGRTT